MTVLSGRRIARRPKIKSKSNSWSNAPKVWRSSNSRRSNNVEALYARGVTPPVLPLYGPGGARLFSALRNAVGARHDHERVLELDPNYVDARLVVGAHNYVMAACVEREGRRGSVGLTGSKEKASNTCTRSPIAKEKIVSTPRSSRPVPATRTPLR